MPEHWKVEFDPNFYKYFKKIGRAEQKQILKYFKKIDGCENPRLFEKKLRHNLKEYWRYRVGNYRILVKLENNKCIVLVLEVGHRKEVYKK
ncbi:MAG: type II toxin-antitoxin system RelE/ParE family toxin [Candidatus Ancillula sp.]|jgi:mRNA interferase RelE/StbE|nr:type II toxin-antitoxin system RelE/ParE family toxin [Candidatus Ancillula sp.]